MKLKKTNNNDGKANIRERIKIKKRANIEKKFDCDLNLVEAIQPAGGLSFKNERFNVTGNSYESCVHVYEFAHNIGRFWISYLLNISGTISTIDISTESIEEVKNNINKSIKEKRAQVNTLNNEIDRYDARQELNDLRQIYAEIQSMNEVVKTIVARIYVYGNTPEELEKNIKRVTSQLAGNGYKAAVYLNEQKQEWQAMYYGYGEQMDFDNKRYGTPYISSVLAEGYPFHFSDLKDPYGTYWGSTPGGGSVIWDMFHKDADRKSYNTAIFGKTGAGKSTILKFLIYDQAIRGNFIRGFDITGEFCKCTERDATGNIISKGGIIEYLNGKIISVNGSQGRINIFDVLKFGDDEFTSWSKHVTKISTIYKYLTPEVSIYEKNYLEQLLRDFYIYFGLYKEKQIDTGFGIKIELEQITDLPAQAYPTLSDFVNFLESNKSKKGTDSNNQAVMLEHITSVMKNLAENYKLFFDGHSTVDNIMSEQIVYFDISSIMGMNENIVDAILYNLISLCWDNCLNVGRVMKEEYENERIDFRDIIRFCIILDEAHHIINTKKLNAVERLVQISREDRKYFGGFVFASQSIRDYIKESASSEAIEQIKTLFEMTQYQFILEQASNTLPVLNQVFKGALTAAQLEQIPKLATGEAILCLSEKQNVRFKTDVSKKMLSIFQGGA